MESAQEWQEHFDQKFPEGALITFIESSESAVPYDDSPQELISKITVTEVDEHGFPTLALGALTGRVFFINVDTITNRPYGYLLGLENEDVSSLQMSSVLTAEQKALVERARKGMWEQ